MRDWTGSPEILTIADPKAKWFAARVDYFLRDLSRGLRRLSDGQVPDGSGDPIADAGGGIYWLLAGRSGGQVGHGGTGFGESATIASTSATTKGYVYLGNNHGVAYDETNTLVGVNKTIPGGRVHIAAAGGSGTQTLTPVSGKSEGGWGSSGGADHSLMLQSDDGGTTIIQSPDTTIGQSSVGFNAPAAGSPTSGWTLYLKARKTAAAEHIGCDVVIWSDATFSGGDYPAGSFSGGTQNVLGYFGTYNPYGLNYELTTSFVEYSFPITASQAANLIATTTGKYNQLELTTRTNIGPNDDGTVGTYIEVTYARITGPGTYDSYPLQRWEHSNGTTIDDLAFASDGGSSHDLLISGDAPLNITAGDDTTGLRLYSASSVAYIEAGTSSQSAMSMILCGNRKAEMTSLKIAATGVAISDVAAASVAAPTAILDLVPGSDINTLRIKSHGASDTNPLLKVESAASTTRMFQVDPSGTVTVGDTGLADNIVRFQIRVPTEQTSANIWQVIKEVTEGNNYTALSMGFSGALVVGDASTTGQAIERLTIRQGSGQSANLWSILSSGGSDALVRTDSTGQTVFGHNGGTGQDAVIKVIARGNSTQSVDLFQVQSETTARFGAHSSGLAKFYDSDASHYTLFDRTADGTSHTLTWPNALPGSDAFFKSTSGGVMSFDTTVYAAASALTAYCLEDNAIAYAVAL